jgi:hypothetical protein
MVKNKLLLPTKDSENIVTVSHVEEIIIKKFLVQLNHVNLKLFFIRCYFILKFYV